MLNLSLDLRGTPFQRDVWAALRDIPPGRTETSAQVAARIGRPGAARAVARACAANPVAMKVNAALITARGTGEGGDGDLRIKVNKDRDGK